MDRSKFDIEFERQERWFNRLFIAVASFIGFVFVVMIAGWIAYGVVAYKTYNQIDQHGLKFVIDQIWNGHETH